MDYGDLLYMNSPSQSSYAGFCIAWCLKINLKLHSLSHHCTLYSKVNLPSLSIRRLSHLYIFIYKAIMGRLPVYISDLLSFKQSSYGLRSQDIVLLKVLQARTEMFNSLSAARFSKALAQSASNLDHC